MHWNLSGHFQACWSSLALSELPKTHCFLELPSKVGHFQRNFTIKVILSHSSCYTTWRLKCPLAFRTSLCSLHVPSVIYYSMSLILDPVLVSAKVKHFILVSKFGIAPQVPSVLVTVKCIGFPFQQFLPLPHNATLQHTHLISLHALCALGL